MGGLEHHLYPPGPPRLRLPSPSERHWHSTRAETRCEKCRMGLHVRVAAAREPAHWMLKMMLHLLLLMLLMLLLLRRRRQESEENVWGDGHARSRTLEASMARD